MKYSRKDANCKAHAHTTLRFEGEKVSGTFLSTDFFDGSILRYVRRPRFLAPIHRAPWSLALTSRSLCQKYPCGTRRLSSGCI